VADENGSFDWREQIQKNWEDHDRIWRSIEALTNDTVNLHKSLVAQKENTDKLLVALRELIDRIPPENLR
jgi:hypothetical protein